MYLYFPAGKNPAIRRSNVTFSILISFFHGQVKSAMKFLLRTLEKSLKIGEEVALPFGSSSHRLTFGSLNNRLYLLPDSR